jgi:hypothetical protein
MINYWICDTCGGKIHSPEEGMIEWYSVDDEKGIRRRANLRLVHGPAASPLIKLNLKRKGCAFDMREESFWSAGWVENRPLGEFLGPDGLMRLLSLISEGEFPVAEVVKMIKRLHIPGYEMARDCFRAATFEGILAPGIQVDFCSQRDIAAVLKWMEERKQAS